MMRQQLIFTAQPGEEIERLVERIHPASVFVICDANVSGLVLPKLSAMSKTVGEAVKIVCSSGDVSKNLDSLSYIWRQLSENGATRSSLVINVGGGMITDMGGFAAATFKRGIKFINLPTTLLAAVDASVGGKTGINFNGLKNEIGAFAEADASIISTVFFDTLPDDELMSGYAEMLKHALLKDRKALADLLAYNIVETGVDHGRLLRLLEENVTVKLNIVEHDFREQGLRKALNLGHTVGHAFESLAMKRNKPVPHGYAVAWGLVVELILSNLTLGFPSDVLNGYSAYVRDNYPALPIDCKDYPGLIEFMMHDKKNSISGQINFTLLRDVGQVATDCIVSADDIKTALDIYRDMMGI